MLVALCCLVLLVAAPAASAQPPNDALAGAQELSGLPAAAQGTNAGATQEEGEPSHGGLGGEASVWYRWSAPASGTVIASVCDADFDSVLAVYTGQSLDSLSEVGSNDDACGSDETASRVRFNAVAGATYLIAVADAVGDTGSFTLRLAVPPPPPQPQPGRYTGRADFGERISFVLSRGRTRVVRFTVRNVDLTCTRGSVRIIRTTFRRSMRVRRNRFRTTIRERARGGFRLRIRVSGRLIAPRRARGTLTYSLRDPRVGRCRHFAGRLDWTALRR